LKASRFGVGESIKIAFFKSIGLKKELCDKLDMKIDKNAITMPRRAGETL
jgi:hypothetical protein